MPLTKKEQKIKRSMHKTYGAKEGESVFYASVNKGNLGQASKKRHQHRPASKRNR
jgi:hypothetical protein